MSDLKASDFVTMINTPSSYTWRITAKIMRFTMTMYEQLIPTNSLTLISFVQDFLANLFQLQAKDEDLTTPEVHSFLKSHGFCPTKSPNTLFSKTLKGYLTTTLDELSELSLKFSPTLGIACNGRFLILSSSAFLKTGKECTLSDVLEQNVSEKYFLSQDAITRILATSKNTL